MTDEPRPETMADTPPQPGDATSVDANRAVSRRWIEVFNARGFDEEVEFTARWSFGNGRLDFNDISLRPSDDEALVWGSQQWTKVD